MLNKLGRFACWSILAILPQVSWAAPNVVVNGDFESGSTGWTIWSSPQSWPTGVFNHDFADGGTTWIPAPYPYEGLGSHSQEVGTNSVHGGIFQTLDVTPGETYEVTGSWAGGVGGFSDLVPDGAWFEIVIYDGAVGADIIDQAPGVGDVLIAKREFIGSEGNFDWESFQGTFVSQSSQVTLALKTGKYGADWDAIASYHDNLEVRQLSRPTSVPTLSVWGVSILAIWLGYIGLVRSRRSQVR